MSQPPDGFLLPWQPVEPGGGFGGELAREVGDGHRLAGVPVETIAHRVDTDDVLFRLLTDPPAYAQVHLTWSTHREHDPAWPSAALFDTLERWKIERMIPDHEEYES